jgi:arylsulfatase A-like enzyme
MIVRDPAPEADATRGKTFDGFVESIDTAPTIMQYLGVATPERFQGKSFLDVIHNKPHAHLKSAIHHEDDFRSMAPKELDPDLCVQWVVRDQHFKYVQFGQPSMPPLLFDLKSDPGEQHNLAADSKYAATVADYCQKLLRWRMKHEDHRMERWASKFR